MSDNKTSISKADTYGDIAEFWDAHDLADFWEQTQPANFEVNIQSEITLYAVDNELSAKILEAAKKAGCICGNPFEFVVTRETVAGSLRIKFQISSTPPVISLNQLRASSCDLVEEPSHPNFLNVTSGNFPKQ